MNDSSGLNYSADYSTSSNLSAGQTMALIGVELVFAVFMIVVLWKVFSKAGQAGWKSIVPIYNAVVEFKIAGMNPWMILLLFVPIANFVVLILFGLNLAKSFGRSPLFGILGLVLFSPVGMAMLAFGKSTYVGPGGVAAGGAPVAPAAPVAPTPPAAPVA